MKNSSLPAVGILTFDVPLPPQGLSPNSDRASSRKAKARLFEAYRTDVHILAVDARNRAGWRAPARARVHLLFGLRRARMVKGQKQPYYYPADWDNAVASAKALMDGLRSAEVIVDDDWEHLEAGAIRHTDGDGPWVRVTVEAVE